MKRVFVILLFIVPACLFGQQVSADSIRRNLFDLEFKRCKIQIQDLDISAQRSELISLELFLEFMISQSELAYEEFRVMTKKLKRQYRRDYGDDSFRSSLFLFRLHLYRAIASAQLEEYPKAAKDIIKSHQAFEKMRKLHPAHRYTLMAGGFFSVLTDQIPVRYEKFIGISGVDTKGVNGFKDLKRAYLQSKGSDAASAAETGLMWLLCLWEFSKDSEDIDDAWSLLNQNEDIRDLTLIRYAGILTGFKIQQMDLVESNLDLMEQDGQMNKIPHTYYQRGRYRLFTRNENCLSDFELFVNTMGYSNYVKSAWLRMGYYWTISGNTTSAELCYNQVLVEGPDRNWVDKQALRECLKEDRPDPLLLSLQLLYDGGYFKECLDESENLFNSGNTYPDHFNAIIYYRKARSLEALGRKNEALTVYSEMLGKYSKVQTYQIPKSAIIAAELLHEKGSEDAAKRFLEIAEETNRYGYQKTFRRQIQALRRRLDK